MYRPESRPIKDTDENRKLLDKETKRCDLRADRKDGYTRQIGKKQTGV